MRNVIVELEQINANSLIEYSLEIDKVNRKKFNNASDFLKDLSYICILKIDDIKNLDLDKKVIIKLSKIIEDGALNYKLTSRIADVLWLKIDSQKKIDYVVIAIENYIQHPLTIAFKDEWDRAISLSISTKKNIDIVKKNLLHTFEKTHDIDSVFIEFLKKYNKKNFKYDNNQLIEIFEKKLNIFTSNDDKQDFLEKYIDFYNDKDSKYNELINYYDKTIKEEKLDEIIGYRKIIDCLHKIEDKEKYNISKQLTKFQNKKIEFQKNIEFQTISESINIREYVNETKRLLKDKSITEIFYQLASFDDKIIDILNNTNNSDEDELLELLTGNLGVFNNDGRKVLKSMNKKEEYYANYLNLFTDSRILPSLKILSEHNVTQQLIFKLCQKAPLIPNDRIEIWSKGIYYGFQKDFILSTSLLVPQIEHLLRVNLKNINENTINHKGNDGIEEEMGIDRLLDKNITKFNEPIYQEFKLILTKPFNLRNDVAHGLINDEYFQTQFTIYFWWLTFKLLILDIKNNDIKL